MTRLARSLRALAGWLFDLGDRIAPDPADPAIDLLLARFRIAAANDRAALDELLAVCNQETSAVSRIIQVDGIVRRVRPDTRYDEVTGVPV